MVIPAPAAIIATPMIMDWVLFKARVVNQLINSNFLRWQEKWTVWAKIDIQTTLTKIRISHRLIVVKDQILEVLDLLVMENLMEAIRRDLQVKLEITWISWRNSVTTSTTGFEIVIRQKNCRISSIIHIWKPYSKQRPTLSKRAKKWDYQIKKIIPLKVNISTTPQLFIIQIKVLL